MFFLQRHGEYDEENGRLTEQGVLQVSQLARKHLLGIEFSFAFFSGMTRAYQTVSKSLQVLEQQLPDSPSPDPGFGFSCIEEGPLSEMFPDEEYYKKLEEQQGDVSLQFMLEHFLPAWVLRNVLSTTMRHWAERIASCSFREEEVNVLVGTHASAVCAAPDPRKITADLGFGEIVRYSWRVDKDGRAELFDCVHLA